MPASNPSELPAPPRYEDGDLAGLFSAARAAEPVPTFLFDPRSSVVASVPLHRSVGAKLWMGGGAGGRRAEVAARTQ